MFDEEPLPTTSPLVGEPCFVLSPHSAALTEDTVRAMSIATVRDVLDAFDGCLDAPSVVNPAVLAASPRHDVDEDGAP